MLASLEIKVKLSKEQKEIIENKLSCDLCDFETSARSLSYHRTTEHEGIRFGCSQCNYKAKTKSHLIIHQESMHEGIIYQCDQCNHKTKRKANLTAHVQAIHQKVIHQCNK